MRKRKIPLAGTLQNNPISTEEIADIAADIQRELETYADPVKREYLPRFFKTGKGEYGEGDKFLGVVVPNTRTVAKQHKDAPFAVMAERKLIYDFYLSQTARINNWDLVDLSAPGIVGEYLKDKSRDDLYRLADGALLWEQRIAVVSTYTLIKNGDFTDILALSERLLHHPHDLMRKAVGWMLREMGKRDKDLLVQFLEKHSKVMPRTMLRYAIEKFPEEERKEFMKR